MTKLDKLRQRIASIFEMKDVPSVDIETLERYLDYLKKHLELPCQLTGIEDFPWEEFYVIGPGNPLSQFIQFCHDDIFSLRD